VQPSVRIQVPRRTAEGAAHVEVPSKEEVDGRPAARARRLAGASDVDFLPIRHFPEHASRPGVDLYDDGINARTIQPRGDPTAIS